MASTEVGTTSLPIHIWAYEYPRGNRQRNITPRILSRADGGNRSSLLQLRGA